jgi:hypothetical protein
MGVTHRLGRVGEPVAVEQVCTPSDTPPFQRLMDWSFLRPAVGVQLPHLELWLNCCVSGPRVHWSVMPTLTSSIYISSLVSALEDLGVDVRRMSLRTLARSSGELVHIQWPEHVSSAPGRFRRTAKGIRSLVLVGVIRARGHRIVLTAHNLEPHFPTNVVDRIFRRTVEGMAEEIVVMAPGQIEELEAAGVENVRHRAVLIRHPVRSPLEAPTASHDGALLMLGMIASYHQPCEFVEALAAAGSTRRVIVVGAVGEQETLASLDRLAEAHEWLETLPGFLPDDELLSVLASTTALVALQRRPFNSGAPFFALPQGLPVILSESALVDDLIEMVGAEWVHPVPRDPLRMDVDALERFLRVERNELDLSPFAPSLIAEQHVQVYENVASRFRASRKSATQGTA